MRKSGLTTTPPTRKKPRRAFKPITDPPSKRVFRKTIDQVAGEYLARLLENGFKCTIQDVVIWINNPTIRDIENIFVQDWIRDDRKRGINIIEGT